MSEIPDHLSRGYGMTTMRARYDITTGQVQIEMSLTEFVQLNKELNDPRVRDQLRTVGIVGDWFRSMCDGVQGALTRAGDGRPGNILTLMTGWWQTPLR